MKETIISMRDVYKKQVIRLKEEWKNGSSNFCERDYKKQLAIWNKRIKQYEEMLDKQG